MKELKQREDEFKIKFETKFTKFEYINGYINCESKIKCRCKTCGTIKERTAQSVRSKKEVRCDDCFKEATRIDNINKVKKVYVRTEEQRIRENKREREKRATLRANEPAKSVQCTRCGELFLRKSGGRTVCICCRNKVQEELKEPMYCKECDALFIRKRLKQPYCSQSCRDRYGYRMADVKRRKIIKENGKIEWDISINRLIKRDGLGCGLCGEEVDLNDFYYTDEGHYLAGNKHPSIDHIKPVSKGGTHTWDNVQLAHRQCNSLKCDNETYSDENNQVKCLI